MTEITEAYGFRGRTEEHTGDETISEDVRQERIETDGDARS